LKKLTKIWDLLWYIVPVLLISVGSVVSKDIQVTKVKVNLSGSEQNHFLEEQQLIDNIESHLGYPLVGGKLIHNDLSSIEKHLKRNKFVYSAEVISDHKGRITIDIQQEAPIARIITNEGGYYLTKSGRKMPTSHNYTSRVTVILGSKINDILSTDSLSDSLRRKNFIEFIQYICDDEFLRAQVETIEVLENEKMILYPQITSQVIYFGNCEDYVDKFNKLKIFYNQILPRKGWKAYSSVNLEYRNQIICE
jgi:cell division protein FtsQ